MLRPYGFTWDTRFAPGSRTRPKGCGYERGERSLRGRKVNVAGRFAQAMACVTRLQGAGGPDASVGAACLAAWYDGAHHLKVRTE